MSVSQKVNFLESSLGRMKKILERDRDESWWTFMRRESWLHLNRAAELDKELASEENTKKTSPEIVVRLKLTDLDEKVNLDEVLYELDKKEVMIQGYRCLVETFRPE
jgi:hypothetical protein